VILLDRARRRRLTQLASDQLVVACAAVFAGAILLLLVGTQLLEWYWLAVLFAASSGYGLWTILRSMPSHYEIAQLIDARLQLFDMLSTAFHFSRTQEPVSATVCEAQAKLATDAAQSADLKAALPFQLPRATYPALVLALIGLSMFGLRYLITHSLDTKPSLVAMALENFFTPSADRQNSQARKPSAADDPQLEKLGVQVNTAETQRPDLDPGADATNIIDTPDVNPDPNGDSAQTQAKTDPTKVPAEGKDAGEPEGNKSQEGAQSKSQDQQGDGDTAGKESPQQANQKNPQQPKQGDQSNMLDKMKDAMNNMLNKLKMQGSQQQQQGSNSKDGQQAGKGQQKSEEKGQPDKNGQQGGQGEAKDQKADAQGQQGQKSESAQGKGGEQGKQPQSADAKSGVGKSDGNKDVQLAEQAAAMGKISEIIGKRQKDLTGQVLIEVSSGKQQLKTAYSSSAAVHKEAGGEMNRDEVPLIYQQYVEKYFDQIRPSAAPPKPATAPATNAPPSKP
jgi:hypothetical protein